MNSSSSPIGVLNSSSSPIGVLNSSSPSGSEDDGIKNSSGIVPSGLFLNLDPTFIGTSIGSEMFNEIKTFIISAASSFLETPSVASFTDCAIFLTS